MVLKEPGRENMDWVHMTQDTDALLNAVMTLRVLSRRGISRLAEQLLASQEELCSKMLVS